MWWRYNIFLLGKYTHRNVLVCIWHWNFSRNIIYFLNKLLIYFAEKVFLLLLCKITKMLINLKFQKIIRLVWAYNICKTVHTFHKVILYKIFTRNLILLVLRNMFFTKLSYVSDYGYILNQICIYAPGTTTAYLLGTIVTILKFY